MGARLRMADYVVVPSPVPTGSRPETVRVAYALKKAKTLRLIIPQSLLLRVDE